MKHQQMTMIATRNKIHPPTQPQDFNLFQWQLSHFKKAQAGSLIQAAASQSPTERMWPATLKKLNHGPCTWGRKMSTLLSPKSAQRSSRHLWAR